ncbi:hypothetical protein JG687_00010078 [Phytophthora cactorum]|uniref:Uncharacterized protein n=1 Tax=Phytophthora cactorum TaxID=29920 RepID=A0A329R8D4_9STRA|nr:hypothetical protein Pcac1_g11546 [Phytophthora cactorum]KAG2791833.1 hypothetical protein PC112_g24095 [Phytophthora cactorum]KAG2808991.1 hypothetical protein PC113_g23917 [Phytophthora cactorum]KAG2813472.1 hypothetical protein PC111_g14384 [Phytophthora cactorum]KAG2874781.1 hypothetical protein PC115_g24069 [Phytophthora cactorum]
MFYYFLPKVMWANIAEESNRYRESVIASVATQQQHRQQRWQATHPNSHVQSLADIKAVLRKAKPFQPHEVVHDIGLLIARVLCPQRRSLGGHWSSSECSAIPRGTFGKYMSRKRFDD